MYMEMKDIALNSMRIKKWMTAKEKQGWKRVQVFVPCPLAELIQEQVRNWKHQNHTFYKQRMR